MVYLLYLMNSHQQLLKIQRLYSIAEGQGRQRSNVHGEVKTPKNWALL